MLQDLFTLILVIARTVVTLIILVYALDDGHVPFRDFDLPREWRKFVAYRFSKINFPLIFYVVFSTYGIAYQITQILEIPVSADFRYTVVNHGTLASILMLGLHFFFEHRWQIRHLNKQKPIE